MLGASWRRFEDPTRSRDPRVRAVVASLAAVPAPAPRAAFRAELRAQLVAITPRIVAESSDSALLVDIAPTAAAARRRAPAAAAPRHSDAFLARVRRVRLGRPLAIAASVLTVLALLLGGAVYMSRKALPGDSLYGLKRASESLQLATAGSDTAKAHDYLSFAATRAEEVRALLSRATASAAGFGPQAGGIDTGTASNIRSTLASADSDVKSASQLLGNQALRSKSGSPLAAVITWAPGQISRLNGIAAAMPAGSLQNRTMTSAQLVARAMARAEALAPAVDCACLSSTGSDDLGPLPCSNCGAVARPSSPAAPVPAPTPNGTGAAATGAPDSPAVPGPNAADSDPDAGQNATSSEAPAPGLHLPTSLPTLNLPLPTPTLPVSVKSCGLGASLGPISIGIGLCPMSIGITHHP